jgi:hypothetical protein
MNPKWGPHTKNNFLIDRWWQNQLLNFSNNYFYICICAYNDSCENPKWEAIIYCKGYCPGNIMSDVLTAGTK